MLQQRSTLFRSTVQDATCYIRHISKAVLTNRLYRCLVLEERSAGMKLRNKNFGMVYRHIPSNFEHSFKVIRLYKCKSVIKLKKVLTCFSYIFCHLSPFPVHKQLTLVLHVTKIAPIFRFTNHKFRWRFYHCHNAQNSPLVSAWAFPVLDRQWHFIGPTASTSADSLSRSPLRYRGRRRTNGHFNISASAAPPAPLAFDRLRRAKGKKTYGTFANDRIMNLQSERKLLRFKCRKCVRYTLHKTGS
jgi:hypothetical protein